MLYFLHPIQLFSSIWHSQSFFQYLSLLFWLTPWTPGFLPTLLATLSQLSLTLPCFASYPNVDIFQDSHLFFLFFLPKWAHIGFQYHNDMHMTVNFISPTLMPWSSDLLQPSAYSISPLRYLMGISNLMGEELLIYFPQICSSPILLFIVIGTTIHFGYLSQRPRGPP